MDGYSLLLGFILGVAVSIMYFGLVLILLETRNPFDDATVNDFLPQGEGG